MPRNSVRVLALAWATTIGGCAAGQPVPPETSAPASEPAPAKMTAAEPLSVPAQIREWFIAAGYQPFQADAMVDHARIESGFDRCVVARSGSVYLFQWLGVRRRRLAEFSGTPGCPSLEAQLKFADTELRSEPAYACFWKAQTRTHALGAVRRGFGRGHC